MCTKCSTIGTSDGIYRNIVVGGVAFVLLGVWGGSRLQAGLIVFDTEMVSMDLTGGPFPMPLASDPANSLGDSIDGYGFVDSNVSVKLSSQRSTNPGQASLGTTTATPLNGPATPGPIDPEALDGQQFVVESFFDVFFDITVTDVDPRPGRDYAGLPHGASITLLDNGPTRINSIYESVFDKDAANFGLFPPPGANPFLGLFDLEIPLGADINGNGENDKIKFSIGVISAGDEDRVFTQLPNGTILNEFDATAFLDGAIVDESTDPPFTLGVLDPATNFPDPGAFGGPTRATSTLQNAVVHPTVPEPSTLALLGSGLASILCCGYRKRVRRVRH